MNTLYNDQLIFLNFNCPIFAPPVPDLPLSRFAPQDCNLFNSGNIIYHCPYNFTDLTVMRFINFSEPYKTSW